VLEVNNVVKYYDKLCAVNDLSFSVNPGEIFGLLGVNGSGKTTTFRMIMGLLEPNSGSITLDGKPIDYSITDQIGFLTEERSLMTKLTVKEQMLFYGALKGMKEDEILTRLDELLEYFEATEYKNKKIKELSKGNQQKIQFISAIINNPKLVILDEPFSGLDPFNTVLFEKAIIDLSKKGSIIIFSSHRMEHVEKFCETMTILVKGKSVLAGNIKKIKQEYSKKNILVEGKITKKELEAIKDVMEVEKTASSYILKVASSEVVPKVFKALSKYEITKFLVEEPSLNEIFIEKVGESYEK
jgi:ABC-2 type transport system ATP-binding protein